MLSLPSLTSSHLIIIVFDIQLSALFRGFLKLQYVPSKSHSMSPAPTKYGFTQKYAWSQNL